MRAHLRGDLPRLVVLITALDDGDLLPLLSLREEVLLLARLVVRDHDVGRVQDARRAAVVLLEADDLGAREVLLEVEDVADVGAAPGVDRLIRIAADRQVLVERGEVPDEQVLHPVGVLVLIHEHVPEAAGVAVANPGVVVEQVEDLEQEVIEVEGVLLLHPLPVLLLHGVIDVLVHAPVGELEPVLAPTVVLTRRDPAADDRGPEALGVVSQLLDDRLDEPVPVGGVVDREVARVPIERVDLPAENSRAHGVEGADPGRAAVPRRHEPLHPLAHLLCSLVGEGDREDLPRGHSSVQDQVRDAGRHDPRLPRARPRHDQEGSVTVEDGLPLLRVQALGEGLIALLRRFGERVLHVQPIHLGGESTRRASARGRQPVSFGRDHG